MPIHNRPFVPSGEDFNRMWHFLSREYTDKKDGFTWSQGRLGDWRYGLWNKQKFDLSFYSQNAQLWLDEFGEPAGFVINEDGGNLFFVLVRRGFEGLYPTMLDWTVANWLPRYPSLRAEVHEFQSEVFPLLAERGFGSLGEVATTRAYDLTHTLLSDLPALRTGFHITTMAENGDYAGKAALYRDAFEEQDTVGEMDLIRYAYSRQNPAYDPTLDFSVLTNSGVHVASCVGFPNSSDRMVEVEKICVHRGYRRQGLGAAVIQACFERLDERGYKRAYITGYSTEANSLYETLFPAARKVWTQFELAGKVAEDPQRAASPAKTE